MQFASRSGPAPELWRRATQVVPQAAIWSWLLVLGLSYTIAASTSTAAWVPGLDVAPKIALLASLIMGAIALMRPVRWPVALVAGVVIGAVVVGVPTGGAVTAGHPTDPHDFSLVTTWGGRISAGVAFADPGFFLYATCWLMWISGAWLAWCSLRMGAPMLGLGPGAVAFASNVLNYPANQNGYVLAFLLFALGLLLWSNYTRSVSSASAAHVRLTGDARWDFWESGLVAMAALIVVGIMLPPLSTIDRTTQFESGMFTDWASLQAKLAHPVPAGPGTGVGTVGFSADVGLGGALERSQVIAFTYNTRGNYAGPLYFRGVDEDITANGVWSYIASPTVKASLGSGATPVFAEDFHSTAIGGVDINMSAPPSGYESVLFYPGRLLNVDRKTEVWGSDLTPGISSPLISIDRLLSLDPPTSAGPYSTTVEYSTATEEQLRAAPTTIPDFIPSFYYSLPFQGYRSPSLQNSIRQLALKITAGATNNYDRVAAIESYLRDTANFTYTLNPPPTPVGVDPIQYFLFTSHKGYCQYFATAMGDMLRSIGIPTRLVNGFGPGTFDGTKNAWVVRGQDAHTWVEVYFPTYGWITFEPTNDGTYGVVQRGTQGETVCIREQGCTNPASTQTGGTTPSAKPKPPAVKDVAPDTSGGPTFPTGPDANTIYKIAGGVLGAILVLLALAVRYLRPRSVNAVWRRALTLARLAGAEQKEGETPFELSKRLTWNFPEAAEPLRALADGFAVAAYAPPEVAVTARASVMDAWSSLRPALLRRIVQRVRPF